MIQWEYKVGMVNIIPGSPKEQQYLNEHGKDGWEFVCILFKYTSAAGSDYHNYYFKRQITKDKYNLEEA